MLTAAIFNFIGTFIILIWMSPSYEPNKQKVVKSEREKLSDLIEKYEKVIR